jgi:thiol:disulfide interchange protein
MTKRIGVILLPLLILMSISFAQTPKATTGIKFFEGKWADALVKSKKEGKPIFLDISASWCGPCKLLKRNTFTDKAVGDFFNKNFINVELDGEVGEGKQLAQYYNLEAYPSLFFVNGQNKVIHKSLGYMTPNDLIEVGKVALTKK